MSFLHKLKLTCGTLAELLQHYEDNDPRGEYVIVIEGKPPEKQTFSVEEAAKITGVAKREIYAAVLGED